MDFNVAISFEQINCRSPFLKCVSLFFLVLSLSLFCSYIFISIRLVFDLSSGFFYSLLLFLDFAPSHFDIVSRIPVAIHMHVHIYIYISISRRIEHRNDIGTKNGKRKKKSSSKLLFFFSSYFTHKSILLLLLLKKTGHWLKV